MSSTAAACVRSPTTLVEVPTRILRASSALNALLAPALRKIVSKGRVRAPRSLKPHPVRPRPSASREETSSVRRIRASDGERHQVTLLEHARKFERLAFDEFLHVGIRQ